jgi:hypothetical protein
MKKRIIFTFLIFILLLNFIFAENITNDETPSLTNLPEGAEKISSDLKNTGDQIKQTTSERLESEIQIPESLQILSKILFGWKETETIKFKVFILFSAIWIFLLLVIQKIVKITPFFENTSWIASVIIMVLIGITGGIKQGSIIWIEMLSSISWLTKLGSWAISIPIILLVIIYFVFTSLTRTLKANAQISSASIEGMKAGAGVAISKIQARNI